jgi:hypothetical protein
MSALDQSVSGPACSRSTISAIAAKGFGRQRCRGVHTGVHGRVLRPIVGRRTLSPGRRCREQRHQPLVLTRAVIYARLKEVRHFSSCQSTTDDGA